jgi:hypothetical protein
MPKDKVSPREDSQSSAFRRHRTEQHVTGVVHPISEDSAISLDSRHILHHKPLPRRTHNNEVTFTQLGARPDPSHGLPERGDNVDSLTPSSQHDTIGYNRQARDEEAS